MAKKKVKAGSKAKKSAKRPKPKLKGKAKSVKSKGTRAGKTKKKMAGAKRSPEVSLEKIGEVTHYFPHVKAAAVKLLKDGLKVGDKIYIKGHTTDFKEAVKSIQLDRVAIQEGRKGQEIGLLVKSRVRQGDSVYRI